MKFKMEINMDNAAFDDAPEKEVLRILVSVGRQVADGYTFNDCYDLNGNKAGRWEIETD